ncbi:Transcription initiation factor IIE subunit alpha, partial [Psidium guajava]
VEVSFAGLEGKEEDVKSEVAATPLIVFRPWMITQRMNLTKEQRGEVGEESKMESLQNEYIKAYYAALLKKQQEPEEYAKKQQHPSDSNIADGHSDTSSSRQVGVKAKRDPEDDVWEEAQYARNAIERYKVGDLNVQADESGEDDDYVDWEEG